MLTPKKTKYRKSFRGRLRGKAYRGSKIEFGEFGLKSEEAAHLASNQLESARKAIVHATKRGGKVWIRIFPHQPATKKPQEVRMGGGKGPVDHYTATVKPGSMIFEMAGVSADLAKRALWLAGRKLPIKTKVIEKEEKV
ncbi:50S ribosomal protein L16 [candidate division WWE3 bacterium CG06_land_8_20_14_3_00_42_16]|uniref:Large ribosomal subunit protein uL16 n=4 Tax=Katanobacteria TaxID=422282 RepID=A0A2M7AMP2_UNCKA|nr:MAG: 50S ribosomal protein L16 [bacterium CG1_02_42_9]PIU68645.1 MAG: 50S ribosomal protein L16 [candidate division WWE3 bacterium CG06_land_8_20_14_3_00_42_16]PIZ43000.1 MAG: 50S ribosomal protein L16 [candidate division WWE3 bacterium CG_4_10_14_0_2_um_filter_42_8]PJA37988.1 MAG: 50S ribosomal protein L16 [candidate division WWE3 bacterium CG_4_9_14_3_um_filter_43_9]PJC69366.1 MAG: 50S ribosomal protein L16 [candidate division WWE3 bacterium CG_4_8_14_3_um_filter_42_11]